MRFRWTTKELDTMTDDEILRGLVTERRSTLNMGLPLDNRLGRISSRLDKRIDAARRLV